MVNREQIDRLLNAKLTRILDIAKAALPDSQFQAYRKLVLDEFGRSGLGKELDRLYSTTMDRQGTGRNTLCKGRGAS